MHDSLDYYSITQRIVAPEAKDLTENLFFLESRSPGYSILASVLYVGINLLPFDTETINESNNADLQGRPPRPENNTPSEQSSNIPSRRESTSMFEQQDKPYRAGGLPSTELTWSKFWGKNYAISQDRVYNWKITFSLWLVTMLFVLLGLLFSIKSYYILIKNRFPDSKIVGFSVIPFLLFISKPFMDNLINKPLYSTMTTFGLVAVLFYLILKIKNGLNSWYINILAGLVFGMIVLTRLELIIFLPVLLMLYYKNIKMLLYFGLGLLMNLCVLLWYNQFVFGKLLNLAIFKWRGK